MKVAREMVRAICERARLRIEMHGMRSSPITEEQRTRFEELKHERTRSYDSKDDVRNDSGRA